MVSHKACVLVTGGSGFIGINIVHTLLEGGYKVHTTTRSLQSKAAIPLKQLQKKYGDNTLKLFEADVLVKGAFKEAMEGVDAVFHVATPVMFVFAPENPDDQIKPAVEGTENVFTACLDYPQIKTIIVTSSSDAVRDSTKDPKLEYDESDHNPEHSVNDAPYVRAKVLAEQYTWKFHEEHKDKFRIVTIHPTTVLGPDLPFESDEYDVKTRNNYGKEVVLRLCNSKVDDDFEGFIDLVDIRDVAKAHVLALETPSATGRFITHCKTIPIKDIKSKVTSIITNTHPKQYPGFQLKSKTQFPAFYFDNTKSQKELGLNYRDLDVTLTDFAKEVASSM